METIEATMKEIIAEAQPFVRKEYTAEELEKKFKMNPFKLHFIQGIKEKGEKATTYQNGHFEDLCRGPHVSDTGKCRFIHLTKITTATFSISEKEEKPVQRVYGVCFDKQEDEDKYQQMLKAAEREHTKIGRVCIITIFIITK